MVPQVNKNKMQAWEMYHLIGCLLIGLAGTETWNQFEEQFNPLGVEIVYLPRTDGVSSTQLARVIKEILDEHSENIKSKL